MADNENGHAQEGVGVPEGAQARTDTPAVTGKRANVIPRLALISSSVALVAVVMLVFATVSNKKSVSNLSASILALQTKISTLESNSVMTELRLIQLEQKRLDLTVKSFQNVDGNFAMRIESVDLHLTGVTVRGAVLNENSTRRADVKFKFTIGNSSQDLSIPNISSGYATRFELYLPDIAKEDTKSASVEFESSNVSYTLSP